MIAQVIVSKRLANGVLDYEIPPGMQVEKFSLVQVPLRNTSVQAIVLELKNKSKFKPKPIERLLSSGPLFTSTQIKLASALEKESFSTLSEIIFSFLPPLNIRDLKNLGGHPKPKNLKTKESIFYIAPWRQRVELFCQKALRSKRQILLVLPTIEKIKQTQEIIRKLSSKNTIVSWHSKIDKKQKAKIWQRVLDGNPLWVIGTRHALFLPFTDLEYVFIDDPTNYAYFDDQAPYYNALSIAKQMSRISHFNFFVMSSVCDLLSYVNIKRGQLKLVENKSKPKIFIKPSWRYLVKSPLFSDFLKKFTSKEKRILIVDRFSKFERPFCQDCQKAFFCPSCKKENLMLLERFCNSCQAEVDTRVCPNCKGTKVKILSNKIEKLKLELGQYFEFLKNDIGLVPTDKKLAICDLKNLDNIKGSFDLVIFPHFDALASTPFLNFRYKLFQTISNLKDLFVTDIIICHDKDNESAFVNLIKNGNWRSFLDEQLLQRKTLSLPPFTRAVKIKFKTKPGKKALEKFSKKIEQLRYFKSLSDIETTVKQTTQTFSILGVVEHKHWANFMQEILNFRSSDYRIEPDPIELA